MKVIVEQRDHTVLAAPALMREFAEFQPDLVMVIDHHRAEMPERFINEVPFVCWIQDELPRLYSPEAGARLGALDFTIGFGRETLSEYFRYPFERFMPCQIVVDPAKFAPEPGRPAVDSTLQCDVAYIGHHAETPQALHDRIRGHVDPQIVTLMDAFYERMVPRMRSAGFNGSHDLGRLLDEAERASGFQLTDAPSRTRMLGAYVRPLADRVMRHATLEWVADWADRTGHRLDQYGRGWEAHPRFGRYASSRP